MQIKYLLSIPIMCLLFIATYFFIGEIYKPGAKLVFSIKCFGNTELEINSRKDTTQNYPNPPLNLFLNSSQFFSQLTLPFSDPEYLKRVRIDFDNIENYVMINKITLMNKSGAQRDTIQSWEGHQIDSLFGHLNNVYIESKNSFFVHLRCDANDPFIEFKSTLWQKYSNYSQPRLSIWLQVLAAILISFLGFILIQKINPIAWHHNLKIALLQGKLLILIFFFIIGIIWLNNKLHIIPDLSNKENRKLVDAPMLTNMNFLDYPDQYTAYAKDNFSFRNLFFHLHALIKAGCFKSSPLPEDAIIGKNDFIFDNEKNVIDDLRHLHTYNANELGIMSKILNQRLQWLAKQNTKFYILIPPNKNIIYPELMPRGYSITDGYGHNFLELLKAHLERNSTVEIIDPTEDLKKAKQQEEVYYSSDTHWNPYGAFIGYRTLIHQIKKDFPFIRPVEASELKIKTRLSYEGDLAKMLSLEKMYPRTEYELSFLDSSKVLRYPKFTSINIQDSNDVWRDGSQLKLIMFRDSYSNYLIPFLNLHFKEAHYLWSYEFLDEVIKKEKPDVVIFECLQRFMTYALYIPNSERVQK